MKKNIQKFTKIRLEATRKTKTNFNQEIQEEALFDF